MRPQEPDKMAIKYYKNERNITYQGKTMLKYQKIG